MGVKYLIFFYKIYHYLAPKINKMTYEEKIENSETRMFKVVFPKIANHHETMFGGAIMETMVEVAFITATRFARKAFVIVGCDYSKFLKPIPEKSLVEFIGKVKSVGNTSLKVEVSAFTEELYSDKRELASIGEFSLVALNEDKKPTPILQEK